MKKIIRKFWGVALVVMMLSTILILPAAPAAAAPYAFSDTAILPSVASGVLAPTVGFGFVAVAQAGDVIYGTATDTALVDYLYKSADGGATWAACAAVGIAAGTWNLVAVAPDDPNTVVVVDTAGLAVYLSTNGGITFANISDTVATPTAIDSIDISPLYGGYHYVLAGGANAAVAYLAKWQIALAATWTPIGVGTAVPVPTEIQAVKYTPNLDIDQAFLFIGKTATDLSLHMYSDAFIATPIDPVGFNYPRVIANDAAAVTCTKAVIVLDEGFFLFDNEIGFIGSDVTTTAVPSVGGVWNIAGGRIQTLATFNSLAWDGTNLMSAGGAAGAPTVYRSANQGATPFVANAPFKGPGTGTAPIVFFAGGAAYCVSQGQDSAVAKSTDLGKSFNGVALVSSTIGNPFNNVLDFWIKSDGSVIYALTWDGVAGPPATGNVDLWRYAGAKWERITILPAVTYGVAEIVRSAQSDTNAIYIAKPANNNRILKSVDGGTSWLLRSCTQNIADLALQSATVAYVASAASGSVLKTANGCTSWTTVGALGVGNVGYDINLLADNQFVVGGTAGGVGYYNGTAFAAIAAPVAAGNAVVAASGTATGDIIFAGTAAGVGAWTIGVSVAWGLDPAAPAITGLAYGNGVLYAFDNTDTPLIPGPPIIPANPPTLNRYYMPAVTLALKDGIDTAAGIVFNGPNTINSLQMVTGSNILWARNAAAAVDTLQSFTEFLLQAVPTLTYPINNVIIPVNSLNGNVNPFNFLWAAPTVALPVGINYNIVVYYDAAGLLPVVALGANTGGTNVGSNPTWALLFTPGVTYYWQVQITAPVHSFPSAMGSFTIQQLTAIVPEISSPPNGSTVTSLSPAFSWSPIAGVATYQFELATAPSFGLMFYTDNVTSSGAMLPVAKKLTAGETYFWRVRALTPAVGEWSQVANFTVAEPAPTPSPTPTITPTFTIPITVPIPSITVTLPQPTVTVVIPTVTQPTPTNVVEKISPAYIWAIIIIGAVLVIAVIVLIVRTRRTV